MSPNEVMKNEEDEKRSQLVLKFVELPQPQTQPAPVQVAKITAISDAKKKRDRAVLIGQLDKSGVFE